MQEQRNRGLIIFDAYFGLDEHIYLVDAGLLIFKMPTTVEEYYNAQLVPIRKKLQLMVENSQLVLERSHFKHIVSRTIFNPCFNPTAKTMVYIKYSYRGL